MKHTFSSGTAIRVPLLTASFASFGVASLLGAEPGSPEAARLDFFERKVRPILVENCYGCHSADTKAAGDLRVDDYHGLISGGRGGPAVVPGDPAKSLLIQRLNHPDERLRMPKESAPLTAEQVADLTAWIADGATWPQEKISSKLASISAGYAKIRESHWAWQPLTKPSVPPVKDAAWPRNDVDRFVLAKLEAEHIRPVADADPETLLRRLSYDLTGLPPSPAAIRAFVADPSPAAFEKEVDRLLASTAFGEHWGRHWLDVARYGESTGPSRNIPYPHAWKYRDYVVDAVNRDVPYDRFIEEQIAGDLLPASNDDEKNRLLTATGFLALGVKDVNQRFKVRFDMDNIDEQIDTVSRSVLGLTVSCARCHDHTFDPVPQADYYALAGIFTSTENRAGLRNRMGGNGLDYYNPAMLVKLAGTMPPPPQDEVDRLEKEVAVTKEAWDKIRGTPEGLKPGPNGRPTQRPFRVKYEAAQSRLSALTDPAARGLAVHGVQDSPKIEDTAIRIRGEAERLGPVVPRGFLTAFTVPGTLPVNRTQSGRLELAEWLTSGRNPLASRVAVNRIWQHLFAEGIVTTVDNFGIKGAPPSHPELLDYLANRFVRENWSVKTMVRTLVLSRAYQLGSSATPQHLDKDPANRLMWRHSPRRMSAEEIRDSVLAASGSLVTTATADPVSKKLRMVEMRDNGAEAAMVHRAADQSQARSLYLPLLRGVTPKSMEAFDPVSQTLVTGRRDETTVPTQALFLLNSSFIRRESLALSRRLLAGQTSDDKRVSELYLGVFGRPTTAAETAAALAFLTETITGFDTPPLAADSPPAEQALARVDSESAAVGDEVANPDDVPRDDQIARDTPVIPANATEAGWMELIQALFASAEFRFVR